MNDKKGKQWIVILVIFLVLLLCAVVGFVLYKKGIILNNTNDEYKMVKILDYYETEDNKNGTMIIETDKYYVLEYSVDYNRHTVLYDKNGNDVTMQVFGMNNVEYIDGLPDYDSNNKNIGDVYIVRTSDGKYGMYDNNFTQIIKIDNYVIEPTNNNDYFMVGDSIENPIISESLENVGVYDKNGKVVIPREYERLFSVGMYASNLDTDETLFYARKNGKYGIIDDKNNVIISFEYDQAPSKLTLGLGEVFKNNGKYYYILYKDGKYGMIDNTSNTIINFEKDDLFYSEYANAVIEKVYNNNNVIKLNVYNLNGELKKEIVLNDNFKATFNAYYYKHGWISPVLYDNDYIYILNNKYDYEKYIKPASMGYGMDDGVFLASDSIYFKELNEKYRVYKANDSSLLIDAEFYLLGTYLTQMEDCYILCKNKLEDGTYSECGIVGYDGNKVLDFNYFSDNGTNLRSDNEFVDFEYNYEKGKYETKSYKINGDCVKNKEYSVGNNIIRVNGASFGISSFYDLNCTKIADDVTNYYILSDDLLLIEKFEDKPHNTYKIYNLNTKKPVEIKNDDEAVITNDIRSNGPIIMTNKGIYKIIK